MAWPCDSSTGETPSGYGSKKPFERHLNNRIGEVWSSPSKKAMEADTSRAARSSLQP
jgi:hypothetical protein